MKGYFFMSISSKLQRSSRKTSDSWKKRQTAPLLLVLIICVWKEKKICRDKEEKRLLDSSFLFGCSVCFLCFYQLKAGNRCIMVFKSTFFLGQNSVAVFRELCGVSAVANLMQCVLALSSSVSGPEGTPLLLFDLRDNYPALEPQGPLPDVLRRVVSTYEMVRKDDIVACLKTWNPSKEKEQ